MSFQAMAWAAAQKTGSPARKALLLAIANYADEDGVCWPSRETLAEDSEQSIDSVDRHIKELEAAGFIKRSARAGRRADGGEQSKLITILFSRERLKNDLASNRRSTHKSLGPQPQIAAEGSAADCGDLSRTVRGSSAANCGPNLSEEPITEPTPLTPEGELRAGSSIDLDEVPSKAASARFDRFREAWPADPTINWERVESGFYRMPAEDQDNASKVARRYVEFCRREGRKLKAPQNWLREKGWAGFLEEERKAAAAIERGRTMVWVQEGTRAWNAWKAHFEAQGKLMKTPMQTKAEKGLGWFFPTLFPPGGGT